jgi:elongation factor G
MKVYNSESIRNIAIASHQGTGKTSLAEAIAFQCGAVKRLGKVTEGNTASDYSPEEVKRKVSVNASLLTCEWNDTKLNLLDVPGFLDFSGEVDAALPVCENVLMTIDAAAGVGVGTELIAERAKELSKATVIFVNKMERENADFEKCIQQLGDALVRPAVPVQLPIGQEADFKGVVNVLSKKAYLFENGGTTEVPLPADMEDEVESAHFRLMEYAADGDDDILMKYLEGEELTDEEIKLGLRGAIAKGLFAPVLCGSALNNQGIDILLGFCSSYLPSPVDCLPAEDADKPLAALVFKSITDPFVGKLNLFKVLQGNMSSVTSLYNSTKGKEEKISGLATMLGKTSIPVDGLAWGDIGVFAKLANTGTNDTLCLKDKQVELEPIKFAVPNYTVAIQPKSKADEDKLGAALQKILEEDPTLQCVKDPVTKQTLLTGMGDTHIDITLERLVRKFNVLVDVVERTLPYRETIRSKATHIEGKHKKQSGGHGQYGHVFIDIEPCYDQDFVFEEKIFGGSVPKQYIPAVEKGLREAIQEGVLAGYPVTNIKVTLTDGSYHDVDSSEMAFKIATNIAFRKACEQAKPVLLEPIMNVEIRVPDEYTGDIMGDINGARRGRIMGMEKEGKVQVITARIPLAELSRYTIDLKSMTQGRGKFTMEPDGYEEAPQPIAEKVIAKSKKD